MLFLFTSFRVAQSVAHGATVFLRKIANPALVQATRFLHHTSESDNALPGQQAQFSQQVHPTNSKMTAVVRQVRRHIIG